MSDSISEGEKSKTIEKLIRLKNIHSKQTVSIRSIIKGTQITATQLEGKFCICSDFESPLENTSWQNGTNIVKHYAFDFPFHHQFAYIQAIERLLKTPVEISQRANYLRTVVLELERIKCHLNDLGVIFSGISYPYLYSKTMRLQSNITKILKYFSSEDPFFIIGGVKQDLSTEEIEKIQRMIHLGLENIQTITRNIQKSGIIKGIFKDVGFITRDTSIKLSLVGPMMRSSGISSDVRKSDPYLAYNDTEFSIPVSDYCDIFGEILVKCDEIRESAKIIQQLLYHLPSDQITSTTSDLNFGSNSVIVRTESPSGQLFYYIHSKDGNLNDTPRLVRLTTPIKINTQGILSRLTGESLENLPYILMTIGHGWRNYYQ